MLGNVKEISNPHLPLESDAYSIIPIVTGELRQCSIKYSAQKYEEAPSEDLKSKQENIVNDLISSTILPLLFAKIYIYISMKTI